MADSPGDRILVTGALGQIGSDLVSRLREVYGQNSVIATDVQDQGDFPAPFLHLDVLDRDSCVKSYRTIRSERFTIWLRYCLRMGKRIQICVSESI